MRTIQAALTPSLASAITLLLAASASAVDLTVQSLEVDQAVQFGTTRLIGGKLTAVRAKIGVAGSASAVAGVDGIMRVFSGGVELPGSPFFSVNGPINAPLSPQSINYNDTLNFAFIPPISGDVDITVVVNPTHHVAESSFTNNTLAVNNTAFLCRATVEVVYVPINYTPLGGPPPANLIEPGIGDGFLRAIYSPNEFNYHRSPLPTLVWNQPINGSSGQLLNTLHDIRINQLPAASYPVPPFIFGWLPGNPFSGNGQSIGVPGDAAFGNTELGRHQRTFAHEFGHLIGQQHSSQTVNTVGIDPERHLWDTEHLGPLFGPTLFDVMVAGLFTDEAYVATGTYNKFLDDSRTQCPPALLAPPLASGPVLRVAGIISTGAIKRVLDFMPVMRIDRGELTPDNTEGDLLVVAYDPAGAELHRVAYRTGTAAELCEAPVAGQSMIAPNAPFTLLIPETVAGRIVHRIDVLDRATGQLLVQRQRTPGSPTVALTSVAEVRGNGVGKVITPMPQGQPANGRQPGGNQAIGKGPQAAAPLTGRIRVQWSASDPDGDPLTFNVLYSPDGGHAWLPLVVNTTANQFEFDSSEIPASRGPNALVRVITSDGMNHGEGTIGPMNLGSGSPPDVYLLTPNTGDQLLQHAPTDFHAAAWDLEDLMLDGSQIAWTSSINGPIGTGRQFINSNLSPGTHTITVTATDLDGMTASKQITLTILPRQIVSPDLNGDGHVNGLDLALLLGAWGPCPSGCAADLNFDNQVNGLDLALLLGAWG